MSRSLSAAAACAALLALPATASAGAPNYDCFVTGGRVTIDQWSGVVAASGFAHQAPVWGNAGDIAQNGPTLDLTAALRGAAWTIAVRGTGSSVTVTRPGGTLSGRCKFIPGNYIVRRADAGGTALRSAPSARAKRVLRVPVGSPVWQDPHRTVTGHWLPVRTLVVRRGSIRAIDGWLRQTRPPISRDVAGSPDY
jgi:hypothetical protein